MLRDELQAAAIAWPDLIEPRVTICLGERDRASIGDFNQDFLRDRHYGQDISNTVIPQYRVFVGRQLAQLAV